MASPAGFQRGLVASSALLMNAPLNPSPRVPTSGLRLSEFDSVFFSLKKYDNKSRIGTKSSQPRLLYGEILSGFFTSTFVPNFKM